MGQRIQLQLDYRLEEGTECSLPGEAVVTFDVDDPFAIKFEFATPDGNVEWAMAVELFELVFRNGKAHHLGGDVLLLLENKRTQLAMFLSSPEGKAKLVLPIKEVRRLFDQITALATPDVLEAYVNREVDRLSRLQ